MKGEEDEILLKLEEGGLIFWNSKRYRTDSLKHLEKYGLIDLLQNGRYSLTEKGRYARKWGYKSFVQFEELEKRKEKTTPEQVFWRDMLMLIAFFVILLFVLAYLMAETIFSQ